jgi:hypothetical protein
VACGIPHHNLQLAATQELPTPMVELVRTNDLVLIGFLQGLLENANIPVLVADSHISAVEGSIGAFPRRILVPDDHAHRARRLVIEAGLEAELKHG